VKEKHAFGVGLHVPVNERVESFVSVLPEESQNSQVFVDRVSGQLLSVVSVHPSVSTLSFEPSDV